MVNTEIMHQLFAAFPEAYINRNLEFIVLPKVNTYFRLEDCYTRRDVEAKLLEWLSRAAHKTLFYKSGKANDKVYKYHLDGINKFIGTNFTKEDMEIIYTYLGNACNHKKTMEFLKSYDMEVLRRISPCP